MLPQSIVRSGKTQQFPHPESANFPLAPLCAASLCLLSRPIVYSGFRGIVHSIRTIIRHFITGRVCAHCSNEAMQYNRVILPLAVAMQVLLASAALGEDYGSNAPRLGGHTLHWGGGSATAAPTPRLTAARKPIAPMPRSADLPVPSERRRGMELAEFEEIARRYNPTLAQAAARIQAARAEWVQAGLYPNPHVGYEAHEMNDEGQAGQQGAAFGQEFVTAGKLRRNRDVAAHALQQAEYAWAAQNGRVLNDVRQAFYEVLVAQRTVELTGRLVGVGQEGVRAAEELFRAQEVSRVDVLQARIEADSAHILAEKARNRRRAAWRNLAVVVGVADMQPVPLSGEIQNGLARLTWEESLGRVLGNSPVLAETRAGVARAEARVERELAERIPNLDLQAGVLYDNATRDTIAEVAVGVALPLFNRNQGNIRKAQMELVTARGEVRRVALELQQRLAMVFERYENARWQAEKYAREILPNAQTSLELVTVGYRQGEFGYVTLLTAQRTFFRVNLAYVETLRELRLATVSIEGDLLDDSLQ